MKMILVLSLIISGALFTETLFEVKDSSNNKVLDVSTDGLRVLNGTDTLMVISTDGIRAYIQKDATKGLSRSFSVTTSSSKEGDTKAQNKVFEVAKDVGSTFFNPNNNADKIFSISKTGITANVNPALNRDFQVNDQVSQKGSGNLMKISNEEVFETVNDSTMLWYKDKNAFRVGHVLITDPQSVGQASFASGYQSQASGSYSTAIGYKSLASGKNSFASGTESVSEGSNSCAIGYKSEATGGSSYALGYAAKATAPSSFSLGMGCTASGQNSLAMGFILTEASAQSTTAIGFGSKANAPFSTSIGQGTNATGEFSTAMGVNTTSQAYNSFAIGKFNLLQGSTTEWIDTDPLFVVGNGSADYSRSNAFEVKKNGNSYISGKVYVKGDEAVSTDGTYFTWGTGGSGNYFPDPVIVSGTYLKIQSDPGSGAAPTSYVYQGNTGSTGKDYAFAVHDALWVTKNAFFDGTMTVAQGSSVPIATFRNTDSANDAYFAVQSGDSLNVNRWDIIAGSDGAFRILDKNANASRMRLYSDGSVVMPSVYSKTVGSTNRDLFIDNSGYIGYVSSSARYKENVKPVEDVSWLYRLNPVSYNYKTDGSKAVQCGLIAEEVEKVNPSYVSYNNQGTPETVSYSSLITPMLKAIQDQQAVIEELRKEIESLKNK